MDLESIRLMKLPAYKGLAMDMEKTLEMEAACETIPFASEDHKEGVDALREKRDPQFKGR